MEIGTKRLIAQLEKLSKRSPAKDIRKQYESQTSYTSIEPDDGSFGQGETGAVSFNLEPFQLHDGVRTSSDDVDEAIETRRALFLLFFLCLNQVYCPYAAI